MVARRAAVVLLAGLVLAAAAPEARAETDPARAALRRRLAADRVRVRYLRTEERSILEGLQTLERGIQDSAERAERLGREAAETETRIVALTERIVANQSRLGDLRDRFGKRAAAMLRLRRARLTRLLRRVSDPNEVRRGRDRFRFVRDYDVALLREMLDATAADRKLRFELTEKRTALEEARAGLATAQEEALELKAEREALLVAIRKERVAAVRLARELGAAQRRLEAQMGKVLGAGPAPEAAPGGFGAQRGRLPWPVTGRLEVAFGLEVDPSSDMVLQQRGIDVRAAQSAPVRAVFAGRVVFAASRAGYGRLAVVDHGGYYTLYAHLESFAVKAGQRVEAQQVLGYVGDSGSTKGAYLYFEIREGRVPVDPMKWLAPG